MPGLPFPWADRPTPKSLSQPGLITFLRHFEFSANYAPDCPYRVYRPEGKQVIHYYEHRGHGEPPDDLEAFLGDVYVSSDRSSESYAIYARMENGWHQWPGPSENGPAHPFVLKRYIWAYRLKVVWLSQHTLSRNRMELGQKKEMPVSQFIAQVMFEADNTMGTTEPSDRKRRLPGQGDAVTYPKRFKFEASDNGDIMEVESASGHTVPSYRADSDIVEQYKLQLNQLTAENADLWEQLRSAEHRERSAQEKALNDNKRLTDLSIQLAGKNEKLAEKNDHLTEKYRELAAVSGRTEGSVNAVDRRNGITAELQKVGEMPVMSSSDQDISTYMNHILAIVSEKTQSLASAEAKIAELELEVADFTLSAEKQGVISVSAQQRIEELEEVVATYVTRESKCLIECQRKIKDMENRMSQVCGTIREKERVYNACRTTVGRLYQVLDEKNVELKGVTGSLHLALAGQKKSDIIARTANNKLNDLHDQMRAWLAQN